jgi:hypothetical protein
VTGHDVVRRLRAMAKGKPLPNGETLRVPKMGASVTEEDTLIVALVRMGGESTPWGVAFGHPGKKPEILTIPEARNRDAVADMMATFAPVLLEHLYHPRYSSDGQTDAKGHPRFKLRQIWVPNPAHLEMLHFIAYSYHRTKFGSATRVELLQALSRACGWLFREAQRPGQMITMVATQVLSEAHTYPSDSIRQGHLGFLLAWLNTKGSRDARMAAAEEAERQSISTSLDPPFERDDLAPDVEAYNEARKDDDRPRIERSERRIRKMLTEELLRRWSLTEEAVRAIQSDRRRENRGIQRLVAASLDEHYRQYLRLERKLEDSEDGPPFFPSPETDRHPAAAGSRYYVAQSSAELRDFMLVQDDKELLAELVADGEAIDGMITSVSCAKDGKKRTVLWTVESDGKKPLRLREGSTLSEVGFAKRRSELLDISQAADDTYRFELHVKEYHTKPDPRGCIAEDQRLVGRRVCLVKATMDGIARRKSQAIWKADGPGAWITHAMPKNLAMDIPDDVAEDLDQIKTGSGR